MVKATVELISSLSLTARGRTMYKGKPIVTTNPSDIAFYKARPKEYLVTVHEPAKEKGSKSAPASVPPKAGKKPSKAPPPPVEEDEEEEEEGEEGDEGEEDEGEDLEDVDVGDGEAVEASDSKPVTYRKSDLEKLNKTTLLAVASNDFGLKLDANASKPKLMEEILKAQIARKQA